MKKAKVSKYGQWKYPGEDTIIPNANGSITMKGVPYPVLGIDDQGNQQMMMPGMDYQFPGNSVYEIPMMAAGGLVNPCPPGQVPDGQGGCIDDLSTPPIPSSSFYNYYMENLNKFKASGLNNAEEIVGKMVKSRRTCKPGDECWEEPEVIKPPVVNDPNIQKVIFNTDKGDIYKVQDRKTKRLIRYEDFNGNPIDINNPNGTPANEFYDRGPNAQPGLMPGKEMKRVAIPSGGFKEGGDISIPDLKKIKIKSLPKAQTQGPIEGKITAAMANQTRDDLDYIMNEDALIKADEERIQKERLETAKMWEDYIPEPPKIKKGKTLFGRDYQIVEVDADPDESGFRKPGEKTKVKTIYYKNGNVAKQEIYNNERGEDEITWHDKDGNVTAEATGRGGYRTFSNGYFQADNNIGYENMKRRNDEIENVSPKNKLDGFLKRAKLNLENMSREGSQPGNSYNTVWPDWENDRFNFTRTKNPDVRKSRGKFEYGGIPRAQDGFLGDLTKQFNITPAPTQGVFDQVNQVINTPKEKQLTPSVIQKAQDVINKQVPEQTTSNIFEQVDKFGEDVRNIKPASNTPSESIYNRFTKMLEAAQPEPEAPKEFTVPEDYYTRLMQEENGVNEGLKEGRYYQYPSHEKGTDTIGYGHKLTEQEQKSGRYKEGLTKDQAIALMRNDVQEHLVRTIEQYNQEFGKGAFDKLNPDLKVLALDYVYNGIPIEEFPNFFGAANKYSSAKDANAKQAALDEMLKQYVRHDDKGVPLGSRNEYTKGVLMNLKQRGGLLKAQESIDWEGLSNPELARRARVAGWDNVDQYRKSGWGYNTVKQKQQELINNPEAQKFARPVENKDQLSANRTSGAQKIVNQAYYTLSNPVEAAGNAMKYGYVPQGNVGNYGHRDDGDGFSTLINDVNPLAWLNAAYRFSNKVDDKNSWTTGMGGLNMTADLVESLPFFGTAKEAMMPMISLSRRTTGPLVKGVYDINSWAFKPNPDAAYKTIGNEAISNFTKEQWQDAAKFLERRQFVKQLQKDKLIGKDVKPLDLNYFARSTDRTRKLTQNALDADATLYRGVRGDKPHAGYQEYTGREYDMMRPAWGNEISEYENMVRAGVDFKNPVSIAEYQATHVPMEAYGYRAGMPDMGKVDAIYAASEPSDYYGNYLFEIKLPRDYSKGDFGDWYNKYFKGQTYLNDVWDAEEKAGRSIYSYVPPTNKEMPLRLSPNGYPIVIGKKGEKLLSVNKEFPFTDLKRLNTDPEYAKAFNEYRESMRNDYNTGWTGKIKKKGGLTKAQQLGQFGNWRDILDYRNAAPQKQNLVGDIRKSTRPSAVSESTKVPTQKLPDNYRELQQQKIAQDAYDALPEELKRRDTLTADTRSDEEKFSRRVLTAITSPMETIAAVNRGYDIPSGYFGMHNAYEGYGVGSPMTSVVDMAAGLPGFITNAAYRQGEQIVDDPLKYAYTMSPLGIIDPETQRQALSNYLDAAAVVPVGRSLTKGLSPLLRSASSSTVGFTKPSLLTNISDANAASYEDDLFRYIADAEGGAGIDREYLMALPEEQYRMYGELSDALRTSGFNPNQNEIRRFLEMDSRLNNRIMPPPDEVVFDSQGFRDVYSNPFAAEGIIDLRRPSSIRDRLFGRLSRNSDIPFSRMRSSSKPQGQFLPTNRSYLTKDETKAIVKDKSELDKLEKLNDREFRDVLITPDGKIKFPEKYKGPKQIVPVETEEWVNEFNDNLDLLNNIIAKNNTSGREYWVTGITKDGYLKFADANGKLTPMYTGITPGKFRGDVADVASMDYMANDIPGLRMESAQPIFGQAVRGTGTYKSLNEYLKKLDLGRIKSGMNSQTEFSRGLWENAIKKGDAFGFYGGPRTVHGIMKKDGGTKKKKAGFQVLTDANGKYVFVKT